MVGPRGNLPWILRTAYVIGLLTALWTVVPSQAVARPYTIDPGPGETGDPTADDQPSPTPPPKVSAAKTQTSVQGATVTTSSGRVSVTTVRMSWKEYLRLAFRIWIR